LATSLTYCSAHDAHTRIAVSGPLLHLSYSDPGHVSTSALLGKIDRLPTSALVELSLRNHLCFAALRSEHGKACHMGTIVRTMFVSFFLFESGFGEGDVSIFVDVDESLGECMAHDLDAPWSLRSNAIPPLRAFSNCTTVNCKLHLTKNWWQAISSLRRTSMRLLISGYPSLHLCNDPKER